MTATRQSETVNRVPLSIAAVTQQNMDQQGIKQVSELVRLVPGLNVINASPSPGVSTFSIRGIVGGTGSATTGIYLDDTNLAKRSNNGVNQNNGAPTPILFDLERVEVLKGPQGTLYGGSSQGGTVRFITPNPSLTTYSGLMRVEGRKVKLGESGYEVGAAFGGPIIQDKLGFRVSGIRRVTPGFIDAYSPYGPISATAGINPAGAASPGRTLLKKDANGILEEGVSGKLLWQVNDRANIMLTTYWSRTKTEGGPNTPSTIYSGKQDGTLASPTETFTTPQVCLGGVRQTPVLPYDGSIALGADLRVASAFAPGNVNCATANAANTPGFYIRPQQTYGPFPQDRQTAYKTAEQDIFPATTEFQAHTINLGYDFEHFTAKAVTSFIHDVSMNTAAGGEDQTQKQTYIGSPLVNTNLTNPVNGQGVGVYNAAGQQIYATVNPVTGALSNTNPTAGAVGAAGGFPLWSLRPNYPGVFTAQSRRNVFQQEVRFASDPNNRPLTWVVGGFYSNAKIHQLYYYADRGLDAGVRGLFGNLPGFLPGGNVANPTVFGQYTRYGVDTVAVCQCDSYLEANIGDTEMAAYGEANLYVTDRLFFTAGVRFSRLTFDFVQVNYSAFGNRYPNAFASYVKASSVDAPTTPKFGVTWQFTDDDLVYATAAKGFRAGGANSPVSPTVCAPALQQLFGPGTDPVESANKVPPTFSPDTVWSYEAGGKFRLWDNKLQLNMAGYRIDWTDVQSTFTLSCGLSFVTNGAAARSEGMDLQMQVRPWRPLTITFNAGYTNARYLEDVKAPAPAPGKLFNKGDTLPVPNWQIATSIQYDWDVFGHRAYIRGDYQWASGYRAIGGPGTSAFSPFTYRSNQRDQLNMRLGMNVTDKLELNVFAFNIWDGQDKLGTATNGANAGIGKTTCNNIACTSYVNFTPFVNQAYQRPRELGIQANYRF